jgi:hypothetical protein
LGGGQLLHNILTFISHSPVKHSNICFSSSNSTVFLKILLNVPFLIRCNCSFRSQSLVELLQLGSTQRIFLTVHPFRYLLFMVDHFREFQDSTVRHWSSRVPIV